MGGEAQVQLVLAGGHVIGGRVLAGGPVGHHPVAAPRRRASKAKRPLSSVTTVSMPGFQGWPRSWE
jgi:hypothetical protein